MQKKDLYTWPVNDYRYYLAHHGVKGQRWGVRNAEWYPISDWKAHLANIGQRVSNKFNKKQNTKGGLDPEISKHLSGGLTEQLSQKDVAVLNKNKQQLFNDTHKQLKADGYSDREIAKMQKKNSGVYYDAFEKSFDKFRDEGRLTGADFDGDTVLDTEISKHLSGGLTEQLSQKDVAVLNKNKQQLFNDTHKQLKEDGYSDAEIAKMQKKNEGAYYDAFEKSFDKLRDTGAFQNSNQSKSLDDVKKQKMNLAKSSNRYDINFLETVQNDPVSKVGGKDLQKEYQKYLDNPSKFMSEFKESEYKTNYKNSKQVREIMAKAKSDGYSSLTESEKKILRKLEA